MPNPKNKGVSPAPWEVPTPWYKNLTVIIAAVLIALWFVGALLPDDTPSYMDSGDMTPAEQYSKDSLMGVYNENEANPTTVQRTVIVTRTVAVGNTNQSDDDYEYDHDYGMNGE